MKIFWMVQVPLLCSNITQYNLFIFSVSVCLLGNSLIVPWRVSVWSAYTQTCSVQRVAHQLRHKHSRSPVSSGASRVMVIVWCAPVIVIRIKAGEELPLASELSYDRDGQIDGLYYIYISDHNQASNSDFKHSKVVVIT